MMLELIKELKASNGEKGWPVAVRDRISYPNARQSIVTEANVAVTFLWTMRDAVLPKLDKKNLAIATNFYTPAGLTGMIRNILGNPHIRYIIMLGEEYASKAKEDQIAFTSANALRAFFSKGLTNRQIPGFEKSVYFDKHIPTEMIQKVRENVILIDLNKEMQASLNEKIKAANKLMKKLEKKKPFTQPKIFEYEATNESYPYEGGPIVVHGSSIPKTWIEVIHNIYRHGKKNLMNANTDREVKEINNIVAVIHDPQNTDLSPNPFLVPLTKAKIESYKKEILSPLLPEGKAYTYGNKLRAYLYPNVEDVQKLVNSKEYKDFEFGKGKHLDKNVCYKRECCEIDQISDIVDVLNRDPYSKSAVAITWHVQNELMRKHKSSPCLVMMQPMIQDEKLNLMVFFRSHDITQGWPENAYGCAAIQKTIADGVGIQPGILTIVSGSAQIYNHYYKQVEDMLAKHRKCETNYHDPKGNFIIEVIDKKIRVSLTHPDTGGSLDTFEGDNALSLSQNIAHAMSLKTDHALYLGAELQKAEYALKHKLNYEQDKEWK